MKKRKTIKAKKPRWRGASVTSQKKEMEKLEILAAEYKQAGDTAREVDNAAKEVEKALEGSSVRGFPVRLLAGMGLCLSPNRSDQRAAELVLLKSLGDLLPALVKERLK